MALAFTPKPSCPVPSNAAITGQLVVSCDVTPPPDPTCEFPIFDFVSPVPPGFTFGCYKPTIKTSTVAGVGGHGVQKLTAEIKYPNSSDTGTCEPEFLFGVSFPCFEITDTVHIGPMVFFEDVGSDSAVLSSLFQVHISYSSSSENGFCEPHFDFKIRFPCSNIKIRPNKLLFIPPPGPMQMSINKVVNRITCEQDFTINMKVPCASFTDCNTTIVFAANMTPKATLSWILVLEGGDTGESDACTYDSFLTIKLPCGKLSSFELICSAELVHTGSDAWSLTLWRRMISFSCGYLIGAGVCAEDS